MSINASTTKYYKTLIRILKKTLHIEMRMYSVSLIQPSERSGIEFPISLSLFLFLSLLCLIEARLVYSININKQYDSICFMKQCCNRIPVLNIYNYIVSQNVVVEKVIVQLSFKSKTSTLPFSKTQRQLQQLFFI